MLAGCEKQSPGNSVAQPPQNPARVSPDDTSQSTSPAQASKPLDLSLSPETLNELAKEAESFSQPENKLPDLFDQASKEKAIKVKARPTLAAGEQAGRKPSLDGATLEVEIQTD